MAQVKATFLSTTGLQENMADDDTLRVAAAPTADVDATNKKYVNDEDATVAQNAQLANNALNAAIQLQINGLITEDANLAQDIADEAAARAAADQAILDLIDEGGSDGNNKFVERDGDDMLGNLTFNGDKITLDKDGDAHFKGDVDVTAGSSYLDNGVELDAAGVVYIGNRTGTDTPALQIYDGTYNRVLIGNQGTATFTGNISCHYPNKTPSGSTDFARIYNAGYFYANRNENNVVVFQAQKDGSTTAIEMFNNGNATFTGTLEANKIDGGEYAV